MINLSFSEKQNDLRNKILEFARKELGHNIVERDKDQVFPGGLWTKCGALKLQGLCIPEEHGGAGLDAVSTAVALEALGHGSMDGGLNFSIAAHLLAIALPLHIYGSDDQKKKYLPKLCDGSLIAANAITEVESGSDVFGMHTLAIKNKDNYQINGRKAFITNAPVSDLILLYVMTNKEKGFHGGVSAFLIESKTPGIVLSDRTDKMGLRTCLMGNIEMKDLSVNKNLLLGKEGAGALIFAESMNWERTLVGALHVGTMQQILELCVEYVNKRKINSESISKHEILKHRIAEMYIKIEAARLMVYKAAFDIDSRSKNTTINASAAKVIASETLNDVCQTALRIFGAAGYITENHIERFMRDAAAAGIYSGTNDIQKNIISGWLRL